MDEISANLINHLIRNVNFDDICKIIIKSEDFKNLEIENIFDLKVGKVLGIIQDALFNYSGKDALCLISSENCTKKFKKYTKLIYLDSSFNNIEKIKGLKRCENLAFLDLKNNNITKIRGLGKCINLVLLNLDNNKISKIEGLGKCSKLEKLCLENNEIEDTKGLKKLKSLKFLSLIGNPILCKENVKYGKNLKELYFDDENFLNNE